MFRDRLIQLRRNFDVTQGEVARALGVSTMAVCKWEKGESSPDMENLKKLADYFHVSLDHLSDRSYLSDDEVRLMSRAMYQLNPEDRRRMLSVAKAMYGEAFEEAERVERIEYGIKEDKDSSENNSPEEEAD